MARICSLFVKTSQLQTLCLVVLLLPLPLFYLLHVHISRESRYTKQGLDHRHMETVKTNVYNTNYSASIRRVLVRETRRLSTGNSGSVFDKRKCKSRICREFLSDKDMGYFGYCWRKSRLKKEPLRSVCQFMNASSRPPIALASFPGSGNTWIRGLLQRATGICTGGIYCDTTLRNNGYPGESLRSGNTLVVKTHQVDPRWTGIYYPPNTTDSYFTKESDIPIYDAAIFLIRNPFHALVAEWNRLMTLNMSLGSRDSHTNTVDAKYFLDNPQWNEFVYSGALLWQDTITGWLVNSHSHRVMVIKYEDMKQDAIPGVMMILDFLEYPYSLSTITQRLKTNYDEFQRSHSNAGFEQFTPEQRLFVKNAINSAILVLESHGLIQACNIRDYLQHSNPS